MNINWYPGHMTKARRALVQKLQLIDLAIEVVDARAPLSTRNPDFDDLFEHKARMCILNKEDLADPNHTKKWVAHFRAQGIPTVSYSATKGDVKALRREIEAVGERIAERYKERGGMQKTVRALVCGIPNVGKSAILNRLAGRRKLQESNRPGVTRGLAWVKISDHMEFMDSPGMLWPKIDDERTGVIIALLGSIRMEVLDEEELSYYLLGLLIKSAPQMLMERYDLAYLEDDPNMVIEQVCKRRGYIMRGGVYDYERGYKNILEEFRNGKMGRITLEVPKDAK